MSLWDVADLCDDTAKESLGEQKIHEHYRDYQRAKDHALHLTHLVMDEKLRNKISACLALDPYVGARESFSRDLFDEELQNVHAALSDVAELIRHLRS